MERAGKKTRDIQFFSEKNGGMVCLHSPIARDYAKYLEKQPWVESYEAGVPLEISNTFPEAVRLPRAGGHPVPHLPGRLRRR